MSQWLHVPIAALAGYRNGYPFKPGHRGTTGRPIVRIEQFLNPEADVDRYDGNDIPLNNHIAAGDLIFTWSGSLAVGFWGREPAYLNQHLFRVDPRPGVNKRWLRWALLEAIERMKPLMHGSAMTHITRRVMEETRLRVPPLKVQRRIADFLDTETARIDTLLATNHHAATLVEERRQAYIETTFWDDSHERRPLAAVCDPRRPIRYGIVLPGPSADDGVPLIKGGDVHRQTLDEGTDSRVDRDLESRYAKSRVHPGDLVYTIRGSFGDVARIPDSLSVANLTQDVARVAPTTVSPAWLAYVLDAASARSYADVVATGATIRGVNIGDLRMMPVPVPPGDAQRRVVFEADEVTGALVDAIDFLRRQRELLRERRQALITAVVSGELEV